jgi:hypothetical protein
VPRGAWAGRLRPGASGDTDGSGLVSDECVVPAASVGPLPSCHDRRTLGARAALRGEEDTAAAASSGDTITSGSGE